MDLKKKIKGFFTLTRKGNGGFTLVELIVVIAILAILGGVAVPAYGGYVKKANMTADRSLVSDIEHALTLAGYSGTFAEGDAGYIVLSTNEVVNGDEIAEGSPLDLVLDDTFGTNWRETLKLKYNDWGSSGWLDGLTGEGAWAIKESNFMTGNREDNLLNDVETMTHMATNLVDSMIGNGSGALSNMTFSNLFTPDGGTCALNETAKTYGITKDSNESWETWGAKPENQYAYSNLLVLAAADEYEKKAKDPSYEISYASTLILSFSSYYAFAGQNEEFAATLDTYMDKLENGEVENAGQGASWFSGLEGEAKKYGYEQYKQDDQSEIDQAAFRAIMAGIGDPNDEQASLVMADINNENLFTGGAVNDMYNEYMNAVDAMYKVYNDTGVDYLLQRGEVAILLSMKDNAVTTVCSMPNE